MSAQCPNYQRPKQVRQEMCRYHLDILALSKQDGLVPERNKLTIILQSSTAAPKAGMNKEFNSSWQGKPQDLSWNKQPYR